MIQHLLRLVAQLFLADEVEALRSSLQILSTFDQKGKARLLPSIIGGALVVGEDRRFFNHCGVDLIAVVRALWRYVSRRELQGASTIEQQLVRTVTERYERTIRRKLREVLLAACVSEVLSKQEVMLVYLSVAYFGWGMRGVSRACDRLGFDLCTLSPYEAAAIIARLKYPQPREKNLRWEYLVQVRTKHILSLLGLARSHEVIDIEGEVNAAFPL